MNTIAIVRNILAIVIGLVIGSTINMAIVIGGSSLVPPPEGVDVSNTESIRASIHLFELKHFITPFLAHALGTFSGVLAAFTIAASHQTIIAYGIGAAFLLGGIVATFMIPAPYWFIGLDLIVAYIPMAWAGIKLIEKTKNARNL